MVREYCRRTSSDASTVGALADRWQMWARSWCQPRPKSESEATSRSNRSGSGEAAAELFRDAGLQRLAADARRQMPALRASSGYPVRAVIEVMMIERGVEMTV